MSLIELSNVSKIYKTSSESLYAVNNVSLSVDEKDFVAIVGASGSGKSTLMNIIGCLDKADNGEYLLMNKKVFDLTDKMTDEIRKNNIGFVFQKFCLIPTLNAKENVMLPLMYKGVDKYERSYLADMALERVGLKERKHHYPNEMSGGQQQRVAVARAIITEPPIILADEPTGNLDSNSGRAVMDLLCELNEQGKTVMLITHDENTAKYAKRRITMKDGKTVQNM